MDNAESILVVILAGFLALFLLLAIVLVVKILKLMETMKEIADRAKEVAGNVEAASEMLKKTAGPLALGKFFVNMADSVRKFKRR